MTSVTVNASQAYNILIGDGLLDSLGEYASSALGNTCRALIVTDDTVAKLYLERAEKSLEKAGFEVSSFIFAHGEASKSIKTLTDILEFAARERFTRSDCFFALGGGVVGDICGFASSVYLRGVRFIQVPTTLLAAVDSSVGGKTGIDLEAGKNLAGAFHQPALVVCDCKTPDTLSDEIFADGCAEIVKYGVINDKTLFESLTENGVKAKLEWTIARCVENKRDIVEKDEFDNGCRQLLNLGHTVGHAIEACSDLKISHGKAVAMGTVCVMRAAVADGLCSMCELSSLISLFRSLGLPTECTYSASALADVASTDKKRKGDSITLAVPYAIGDTRLVKMPLSELQVFISKGLK